MSVTVVTPRTFTDARGAFHVWTPPFPPALEFTVVNPHAGTIRGLHYQAAPDGQAKFVRVTRGAIWDVAVNLETRETVARCLVAGPTKHGLLIPAGFAHGYQTLVDDTEVSYAVDAPYVPEAEQGLRWDDPALKLDWPMMTTRISPRDAAWPLLTNG